MKRNKNKILILIFQIHFNLIKGHEFIDDSLGLILRNTSDHTVILTDGTLTIPSEIRIEIPILKTTGQCSLKQHTINQTEWLNNNNTSDYSKKIGALNALIHADMVNESNKIVEKLQERLGNIKTDKIFSLDATSEFAADPKLCDTAPYTCEFHVPAVPMKCTHGGGLQYYSEGHVIKGFIWNWTRNQSYQNFKGLSCGNILKSGETDDALTYSIGPSICCELNSDKQHRSCPSEAIKALDQYNDKSKNMDHGLEPGNTYCISLKSMKKRPPKQTRKKRSFLQYWSVGGGLTSNYIDDKTHSMKTVMEHEIETLRNEITTNRNIVQSITSTTTSAMAEIERLMCTNNLDTWEQIMKLNVNEVVSKAHFEIESGFRACEEGNLPYSIEEKTLRKLCYSATIDDLENCKYITLLSTCVTKDVLIEGNFILIHIELMLQLPSSEPGLNHKLLESFPVPNEALTSVNTIIKDEIEDHRPTNNIIKNDTETIESLFKKIINKIDTKEVEMTEPKAEVKRPKRDVQIFNYLSIDIPRLHIFYRANDIFNFVAFYDCKTKHPIQYCSLGEHEYRGKACLQAILAKRSNTIKGSCPVQVTTGNSCVVTKLKGAFLISTYTDIKILNDSQNRKSIFASSSNTCKAHKVCIIKPAKTDQMFYCNGLKYRIPRIEQGKLQNNITLIKNAEFSLLNFNFKGINDSLEKLKVIKIPKLNPIIMTEKHQDILLWIVLAVLSTTVIIGTGFLIFTCYNKWFRRTRSTTIIEVPLSNIVHRQDEISRSGTIRRTDSQASVRLLGI